MTKNKRGPVRVIHLDTFNIQVAVYRSDKARVRDLVKRGLPSVGRMNGHAFGSAHLDRDSNGRAWFSMVLPDSATVATQAHECVHIADWIMKELGIPTGAKNTEVRAYMVGHLMSYISGAWD